jgi:transcription initiation factor TFIIB
MLPLPSYVKEQVNFKLRCPACRSETPNLVEDFSAGDLICGDCGIVVGGRIIDTRSEWRNFANDGTSGDDPSRVGGPSNPLLDGGSLGTIIGSLDNYSGASKELSRAQGRATMRPGEKALMAAFRNISTICDRIGLPRAIVDKAKQIYKLVDDEKTLKGKNTDGVIAACIYLACRHEGVTRTYKEISALTLVPKKEIGRCFKLILPLLKQPAPPLAAPTPSSSSSSASSTVISAPTSESTGGFMGIVSTEDFVTRFCSHLRLGMDVQKLAVSVLKRCSELGIVAGKSPISVAAAAIYLVSHLFPGQGKSVRDLNTVSSVSEGTIKGTYRELYTHRTQLLPTLPADLLQSLPLI